MGIIKTDINTPDKDWLTDLLLIIFFQLSFYIVPFVTMYAVLTMNWPIIAILLGFVIIQHFAKKSTIFIQLVKKYCPPAKYFRRFLRIFD